jgi:hypothetical protein
VEEAFHPGNMKPRCVTAQRLLLRRFPTKKSSAFFPFFNAATSHLGFAPRPAQVLPARSRYLTGAFRPLRGCAAPPDLPESLESSFRSWAALLLKVFSISARSFRSASTDIEERLGLGICYLQRERAHLYPLYWSKQINGFSRLLQT